MKNHLNLLSCLAGFCFLAASSVYGAESKAIPLFNEKDLTGWKTVGRGSNQWQVGKAELDASSPSKIKVTFPGTELVSPASGLNLATTEEYGDCLVEMEFMMAKHSNSGIKMMNIYEIQLLDSYGKPVAGKSDCGAVYLENAPRVNACKKPGEWQTLMIDWRAPRFDASGKKTANAKFVKVVLNGQVIQENVEIAHGTNVGRNAKEKPKASIYLQGDHGPVAFRNLKVTPLE